MFGTAHLPSYNNNLVLALCFATRIDRSPARLDRLLIPFDIDPSILLNDLEFR